MVNPGLSREINRKFDENTLISVVIPAYNAAKFIAATIESIADQTWLALEIVVVDDASTDGTAQVAKKTLQKLERKVEFQLLSHPENLGAGEALNTGFSHARGELIAWLSADDIYLKKDKLLNQMQVMKFADFSWDENFYIGDPETSETFESVTADWPEHLGSLSGLSRWEGVYAPLGLCFTNPINGSSLLMWADMYRAIGKFLSPYRNVDSDCDYWMRSFSQGMIGLPSGQASAILYRVHDSQTSANTQAMSIGSAVCRLAALQRYLGDEHHPVKPLIEVIKAAMADKCHLSKPLSSYCIFLELLKHKNLSVRIHARRALLSLQVRGLRVSKNELQAITEMVSKHNQDVDANDLQR